MLKYQFLTKVAVNCKEVLYFFFCPGDGIQDTAQAGDRGLRIVALSISSHEQTQ